MGFLGIFEKDFFLNQKYFFGKNFSEIFLVQFQKIIFFFSQEIFSFNELFLVESHLKLNNH